mgnify:CR=1 FL=1
MEKLRKAMRLLLVVANLLAIIALLLVGYSDLLQPESWPKLSNVGLLMPAVILANLFFLVLWILLRPRLLWLPVAGLCPHPPIHTLQPHGGAAPRRFETVVMERGHV